MFSEGDFYEAFACFLARLDLKSPSAACLSGGLRRVGPEEAGGLAGDWEEGLVASWHLAYLMALSSRDNGQAEAELAPGYLLLTSLYHLFSDNDRCF